MASLAWEMAGGAGFTNDTSASQNIRQIGDDCQKEGNSSGGGDRFLVAESSNLAEGLVALKKVSPVIRADSYAPLA